MWSAISSYLGEPAPPAPPTTPRRSPPTTPRKLSTVMTSSAEKRAHDAPNGTHGTSVTNESSQKVEEVAILRGIIVGTAQSGKTSLLRRLRGEDITDGETRKLMALLPWKIPNDTLGSNLQVHQEVVQLYLSEAVSFVLPDDTNQSVDERKTAMSKEWRDRIHQATRKHARKQVDFIVWMVDARQGSLVEFVQLGLECLFPPADTNIEQKEAREDKAVAPQHDNRITVQSLCILLNFRDLQKDNESVLQQIRDLADKVISRHKTNNVTSTTMQALSILVYEASMLTNYGIQSLQSFITLPYLMYKENEYQRRIREVRKGYEAVEQGLMSSNDTSYGDYIKQNGAAAAKKHMTTPNRSSTTSRKHSNSSDLNKTRSDSLELSRSIDKQLDEVIIPDGKPRQLFPTQQLSQPVWTPLNSTTQNLDSFFSDDESDHENESTVKQEVASKKTKAANVVLDSSDDESNSGSDNDMTSDDEFYIDNTGQRHDHLEQSNGYKQQLEEKKEDDKSSTGDVVDDTAVEATENMKENAEVEKNQVNANNLDTPESTHNGDDVQTNGDGDDTGSLTSEEPRGVEIMEEEDELSATEIGLPSGDGVEPDVGDTSRDFDKAKLDDESDEVGHNVIKEDAEPTHKTESLHNSQQKEGAQSQMILDSDDESSTGNAQNKVLLDSDDESINVVQNRVKSKTEDDRGNHRDEDKPKAEMLAPPNKAPVNTKKDEPEPKPVPTVSNAALAAIEAARLEAEQALGGSSTATKSKEKKSKKEKKKSKDKSKKTKKKENKSPDK